LAKDKGLQQKLAAQAERYTNHQLSFQNTTQPFQDWAREPKFAPDRVEKKSGFDIRELEYSFRAGVRSSLWKIWALERGE